MGTAHLVTDAAAASFGRCMFKKLFEAFVDGQWEIELNDLITKDAVDCGLVRKEIYNPEIHDINTDGEIQAGDDIWVITEIGKEVRSF